MGVSRKLAGAGVIAGLSALALVASPAVSSATVSGTWTSTVSGSKITTTVTGLKTTLPFNYCEAYVYKGESTEFVRADVVQEYLITGTDIVKDQVLAGVSGTGTSTDLPVGNYWSVLKCKETEGATGYQIIGLPKFVSITDGTDVDPGTDEPGGGLLDGLLSALGS